MGNLQAIDSKFVSRVIVNEELPVDQRGQVLAAAVLSPAPREGSARLLNLAVVSARLIQVFCLVTGAKRDEQYVPPSGVYLVKAVHSEDGLLGNIFIVVDSTDTIHFIDAYALSSLGQVSADSSTTSLLLAMPDLFYSGHADGTIKVWHVSCDTLQHSWHFDGLVVKAMAYSHTNKRLVVVFEQANEPRVLLTSSLEQGQEPPSLKTAESPCVDVAVADRKNLVIGLSAQANKIYVWDLLTCEALLQFELPQLRASVEIGTKLGIVQLVGNADVLLIGMTSGATIVSKIVVETEAVEWIPLKAINLVEETESAVISTCIQYAHKLDALLLGFSDSAVTIVTEFIAKGLVLDQN